MPMIFLFATERRKAQEAIMATIVRLGMIAVTMGALGALWVRNGPFTAIAAGLTLFAFLFVLAMKSAAEDILQFEREQRPDLYA